MHWCHWIQTYSKVLKQHNLKSFTWNIAVGFDSSEVLESGSLPMMPWGRVMRLFDMALFYKCLKRGVKGHGEHSVTSMTDFQCRPLMCDLHLNSAKRARSPQRCSIHAGRAAFLRLWIIKSSNGKHDLFLLLYFGPKQANERFNYTACNYTEKS